MSVQSEITRLANAKTALATAIEGKGVTVPDGTKLDGMAVLVEAISAGGGGSGGGGIPSPFTKITTGTFTLASLSYANAYPITHGLGKTPKIFAVYHDEGGYYSGGAIDYLFYIDNVNTYSSDAPCGGFCINKTTTNTGSQKRSTFVISEDTFTFNNSTAYFGSAATYRWVAIA